MPFSRKLPVLLVCLWCTCLGVARAQLGVSPTTPSMPSTPQAGSTGTGVPGLRTAMKCAVDSTGSMSAWISGRRGLWVEGWPGTHGAELRLGRGSWPRFLPDGRLVFELTEDDGHTTSTSLAFVLEPGSLKARTAWPGEELGMWVAPPTLQAATGATRVCLDAGHGGMDPGALGNGLQEKDVTLDVVLRLADLLATDNGDESGGGSWDVLLTRTDDSDVSLAERVTMANAFAAESYLSLHANAFGDPAAQGTETYAWAEATVAAQLRDRVHTRMLQAWNLVDRGTKTAGFYVLLMTTMPASLSEMGFITSPVDSVLLGDPDARESMALAHVFALQEHHGYTIHEPSLFEILRGGVYGTVGKPSLIGKGPLIAGSSFSMKLVDGLPLSTAVLFYSFTSSPTPFLGGLLYPFPAPRLLFLQTDAAGAAQGSGQWPAGLPSGTQIWYQAGVVDPFVPVHGASLSDAVVSTTP